MAQNNDEPLWLLILFFAMLAGFGWLIWYLLRPEFLEVLRYLRLVEIAPLALFNDNASACFSWLRVAPINDNAPSGSILMASANCFGVDRLKELSYEEAKEYYNLSAASIGEVGRFAGSFYKWVIIAISGFFAYHMAFVTERNKFKQKMTLESFIEVQSRTWLTLKPLVDFNPTKHSARILGSKMPKKIPSFAEAMAPEEWLAFNKIPIEKGIPDKDLTRRALMNQLGPRFKGFDDLPPYILLLFAAFALKGAQKRDDSDAFLGKVTLCWSQKRGFRPTREILNEAKKYLKDPEIGGLALEVAKKYAFRSTAFLGVIKWARSQGGVLASAQFLWLRGVDRALWYAGNNLGRRTFHTEGAGAMAHFMAEDLAQKELPIPRLETAIVTINQYLASHQPKIPEAE
jgi:intracellular multiplication protein IcmP